MVDPDKTLAALDDLALLVTLDHRMSETAERSDYFISTATQYERHDLNALTEGLSPRSYLCYFRPPIKKPNSVMYDWEVFYELAQVMNLQLDFKHTFIGMEYCATPPGRGLDMSNKPGDEQLLRWLCEDRNVSFDDLKAAQHGIYPYLPPAVVSIPEQDSGARMDICPEDIEADIARVRSQAIRKDKYRLSVRRLSVAINSHYRNSDYARKKFPQNFAYINPEDMADEGLVDGSKIKISTVDGSIIGIVRQDHTLRRGVVSMTHCFGKLNPEDDPNLDFGSHVGRLIPLDPTRAEAINFMPHKTGIPVEISSLSF